MYESTGIIGTFIQWNIDISLVLILKLWLSFSNSTSVSYQKSETLNKHPRKYMSACRKINTIQSFQTRLNVTNKWCIIAAESKIIILSFLLQLQYKSRRKCTEFFFFMPMFSNRIKHCMFHFPVSCLVSRNDCFKSWSSQSK